VKAQNVAFDDLSGTVVLYHKKMRIMGLYTAPSKK